MLNFKKKLIKALFPKTYVWIGKDWWSQGKMAGRIEAQNEIEKRFDDYSLDSFNSQELVLGFQYANTLVRRSL